MSKPILVTGGLGFIGSHACVALAAEGYDIVVIDNLHNCRRSVLGRLQRLCAGPIAFEEIDIRDAGGLERLFAAHDFASVMHFAGLKAVGESVEQPLLYFDNNIRGTVTLLNAMTKASVKSMVFSSSCTVYGDPASVPVREDFPLQTTNPYGRTKLILEHMLRDIHASDGSWKIALLRYFNPVGAHESGTLGEEPRGIPNNLMPYVAQVAIGERDRLRVFGNDYPTLDGTGVRDYIHVMDLADGHVAAQRYLEATGGLLTVNLGTGGGYSVLQMVQAVERASGRPVPYEILPRRPGDVAQTYGDVSCSKELLGWSTRRGLDEICADAWRWQQWSATHAAADD